MPRQYGSPIGVEQPKQENRTKAAPGNAKSYLEHMAEAHRNFESQRSAPQPRQPPKSSGHQSTYASVLGVGKPKVRRHLEEGEKANE